MGRLGGILGRQQAILGVLERFFGDSGVSSTVFGASWEPSEAVLELRNEPGEPGPPLMSSRRALMSSSRAPPLQIDRIRLPGEGFGEGEVSHTPMIPKGPRGRRMTGSASGVHRWFWGLIFSN